MSDPFVIETGKLRTVGTAFVSDAQPYHAMCMKVRVTELEKEENTSGEVGEEKVESGEKKAESGEKKAESEEKEKIERGAEGNSMSVEVEKAGNDATTHMEEEETIDEELIRVMRWIGEKNRVDGESIAREFSLKEYDVLSTLEKLRRP